MWPTKTKPETKSLRGEETEQFQTLQYMSVYQKFVSLGFCKLNPRTAA